MCQLTCKVEQLGEEGAAGGLALNACLSHALSLQHHVPILLIDALRTLSQGLCHLRVPQTQQMRPGIVLCTASTILSVSKNSLFVLLAGTLLPEGLPVVLKGQAQA